MLPNLDEEEKPSQRYNAHIRSLHKDGKGFMIAHLQRHLEGDGSGWCREEMGFMESEIYNCSFATGWIQRGYGRSWVVL